MTHIIIMVLLWLIISRLANSEMDSIAHRHSKSWINKTWFQFIIIKIFRIKDYGKFVTKWYLANNWKPDPKWNCCGINIRKTLFAFTLDGWHAHKFIMIYMSSILIVDYILFFFGIQNYLYSILLGIPFTFIVGAFFELFYEDYIGI